MNVTRFRLIAVLAAVCMPLAASQARANLLSNPGFEDPVTTEGTEFVGSWEAFNGGAGSASVNGTTMPRSGDQHLDVSITNTDNTFAGAFQDVPNLIAGQTGIFSGWHKTTTDPLDLDVEVRIEWRNSVSNTEVSRTPNSLPVPTSDYTPFSLTAMVPAGADTARVVYAIQTFSGGPTNNGIVFVDDVSFVIPEPATFVLLGMGAIGLACSRKRRTAAHN
jgi:PEP-CTERM motif